MPQTEPAVQVNEVARLERALLEARRKAATSLRAAREARGISLRTAADEVDLSPGALSDLERARSWQTSTAQRVVKYLSAKKVA